VLHLHGPGEGHCAGPLRPHAVRRLRPEGGRLPPVQGARHQPPQVLHLTDRCPAISPGWAPSSSALSRGFRGPMRCDGWGHAALYVFQRLTA
jgi:hypothetical protein